MQLMSMKCQIPCLLWIVTCLGPCLAAAVAFGPAASAGPPTRSFADDVAFLRTHTKILVLADERDEAQVAIAPAWQGRVMTSTAAGGAGSSYGWINRAFIAAGGVDPHINVFGGEDRFWLGPEGGQFSIFFAKGAPFDLEHWFTPRPIDTEPFEVVRSTRDSAEFRHAFALTNYAGTALDVRVNRTVRLLAAAEAWKALGLPAASGISMVAFESVNAITNAGRTAWTADTGLLSIWILGMFNPSLATTIVVPITPGPESRLGKAVNADYFGAVPPDRLVVKDGAVFFSGDGQYRSKIGVGPQRVRQVLGSFDAASQVLTLVQFTVPPAPHGYVNSKWEIQQQPYAGDVANSYNDGPPAPGAKPLGPFYELESSSPAAALAPGASLEHVHRTLHLTGTRAALDAIARATLGVGLDEIERALPKK
jgi:hypothetical protein